MSLFAILRSTAPMTPEETLAAAFPGLPVGSASPRAHVMTEFLHATSMIDEPSPFAMELYGIIPHTDIFFRLDMENSIEARTHLADAVRHFLGAVTGDVVVSYLDKIVVKRIGSTKLCANDYADMVPKEDKS